MQFGSERSICVRGLYPKIQLSWPILLMITWDSFDVKAVGFLGISRTFDFGNFVEELAHLLFVMKAVRKRTLTVHCKALDT